MRQKRNSVIPFGSGKHPENPRKATNRAENMRFLKD
jgi:hypothetical protein